MIHLLSATARRNCLPILKNITYPSVHPNPLFASKVKFVLNSVCVFVCVIRIHVQYTVLAYREILLYTMMYINKTDRVLYRDTVP